MDIHPGYARLCRGNPRQLGLQNGVVDFLHLIAGLPHRHSPGHIGAVSAKFAAEIHCDKVAPLYLPIAGNAMGQAAVWPGHHNGVKGHLLRPKAEHVILELGCDLLLGESGPDKAQNLVQGALGDPLCLDHQRNLLLVLAGTELLQQIGGGYQFG